MSFTKRLAETLRLDLIDSGALQPGDRLPTVRELADKYATSLATVSQALEKLQLEGLIDKQQGRGTFLAEPKSEEELNAPPTKTATLILPRMSQAELNIHIVEGAQRAARRQDWRVDVVTGDNTIETERRLVCEAIEQGREAILIYPVIRSLEQLHNSYFDDLNDAPPIVLIDQAFPEQGHLQVVLDNQRVGCVVTRLLIERGHEHIAFMREVGGAGRLMHRSNNDRYLGYLAALKEASLTPLATDLWNIDGEKIHSSPEGLIVHVDHLLEQWKQSSPQPTALIALEDGWAHNIYNEARALGIAIPNDLELVGFDCLNEGRTIRPRYTTTRPDFVRVGEAAFELALQQAESHIAPPHTYVLPVPVVVRTNDADGYHEEVIPS